MIFSCPKCRTTHSKPQRELRGATSVVCRNCGTLFWVDAGGVLSEPPGSLEEVAPGSSSAPEAATIDADTGDSALLAPAWGLGLDDSATSDSAVEPAAEALEESTEDNLRFDPDALHSGTGLTTAPTDVVACALEDSQSAAAENGASGAELGSVEAMPTGVSEEEVPPENLAFANEGVSPPPGNPADEDGWVGEVEEAAAGMPDRDEEWGGAPVDEASLGPDSPAWEFNGGERPPAEARFEDVASGELFALGDSPASETPAAASHEPEPAAMDVEGWEIGDPRLAPVSIAPPSVGTDWREGTGWLARTFRAAQVWPYTRWLAAAAGLGLMLVLVQSAFDGPTSPAESGAAQTPSRMYLSGTQVLTVGPGNPDVFAAVARLRQGSWVLPIRSGDDHVLVEDHLGRVGFLPSDALTATPVSLSVDQAFVACRRAPLDPSLEQCLSWMHEQWERCQTRCVPPEVETCAAQCSEHAHQCRAGCERTRPHAFPPGARSAPGSSAGRAVVPPTANPKRNAAAASRRRRGGR